MRKFKFKFETVATVKKRAEDAALRALGIAQQAYHLALRNKQNILNQLMDSLDRREDLGQAGVFASAFQLENNFIAGTKQRVIQADQQIMKMQRNVEKALRAFLFARKQTRTIEVLREKEMAEFKKAAQKREQKELDDFYIMRRNSEAMQERFSG